MSVGSVYAKALYGVLKDKNMSAQDLARAEAELSDLETMIVQNRNLRMALSGAIGTAADREAVVAEITKKMGLLEPVAKLALLVSRKNRWSQIGEIQRAFSRLCLEAAGGLLGTVESADPLEARDLEELQDSFSKKTGKKVKFQVLIDPALIAGVRITVNGVTYDGTIKASLQRFKNLFTGARQASGLAK